MNNIDLEVFSENEKNLFSIIHGKEYKQTLLAYSTNPVALYTHSCARVLVEQKFIGQEVTGAFIRAINHLLFEGKYRMNPEFEELIKF
jgi:hypothetical protein